MSPTVGALVAVAVAFITATASYLAASRKLSGKIGTSEAKDLWNESKAIRDDYRERVAQAELRTATVEARLAVVERENNQLAKENNGCKMRLEALEEENRILRQTIIELKIKNA